MHRGKFVRQMDRGTVTAAYEVIRGAAVRGSIHEARTGRPGEVCAA